MLELYLGVFLGLSQVSGECNYRFVILCNTGLVHPAGSILYKTRGNGEGGRCFYCSTLPSTLCWCERDWFGSGVTPKPGLTQGWSLTKQRRVIALGAECVFFHLKGKGRTKLSFTLVWTGLFCPWNTHGNFVDAHVLPACWVPMGNSVLCMLNPLFLTIWSSPFLN